MKIPFSLCALFQGFLSPPPRGGEVFADVFHFGLGKGRGGEGRGMIFIFWIEYIQRLPIFFGSGFVDFIRGFNLSCFSMLCNGVLDFR